VLGGIEMLHHSQGRFNDSWMQSCFSFLQQHAPSLPAGQLPPGIAAAAAERSIADFWRQRLAHEPLSDAIRRQWEALLPPSPKHNPSWAHRVKAWWQRKKLT
jgi:hypothetical protein